MSNETPKEQSKTYRPHRTRDEVVARLEELDIDNKREAEMKARKARQKKKQ